MLHLTYLSFFFFLIFNILVFPLFFSLYFFEKKILFFSFTFGIFITLHFTYLFHIFCSNLGSFVICSCNFSSLFFEKLLCKTKSKYYFSVAIAILFYLFTTLKINLRSYTSLLIY